MLKDLDGDGVVDTQKVILSLQNIHGIAIQGSRMFLTDVVKVYVAEIGASGEIGPLAVVTRNLPDGGQHPNRTLGFGPDGALYLSIGSTCNACIEPNRENVTLVQVDLNTGKRTSLYWGVARCLCLSNSGVIGSSCVRP